MPEVIYPTSDRIKGIWLLSGQALQELDELIAEEHQRLTKFREAAVRAEIGREQRRTAKRYFSNDDDRRTAIAQVRKDVPKGYPFSMDERAVFVRCKSRAEIRARSFGDIIHDQSLRNETPIAFEIRIRRGEHASRISLSSETFSNELSMQFTPADDPSSGAMLSKFQAWALTHRLPKWCYHWRSFFPFMSALFAVWWLFAYFGIRAAQTENVSEQLLRERTRELLEEGLTDSELNEAVEILLSHAIRPHPPLERSQMRPWTQAVFAALAVLLVASAFPPSTVLGIGRGERPMRVRRWWIRFISRTLPRFLVAFAILGVLASMVGAELQQWFSRLF